MISRRKLVLAAALLTPLLLWTGLVAVKSYNLYFAPHHLVLRVYGCDPRDLLSGRYLQYQVDYGRQGAGSCSGEREQYMLDPGTPQARLRSEPDDSLFYIKGRCVRGRFQAGVERFYVPEQQAPELDRILRAAEIPASIAVRVSAGGQAQIREFLLQGQPWDLFLEAARQP